jgi:V8-like Glu-specific endopeptidase
MSPSKRSVLTRSARHSAVLALALTSVVACDLPAEHELAAGLQQAPVVYGADDRRDWWQVDDPALQQLTRQSIVALMSLSSFDRSDPENWRVTGNPLGENLNLCDGELYADQPAAAGCSGTLIGPDLVLTAGHCVGQDSCDGTLLVFDYFERADGVLETISAADAYPCVEVVSWALSDGLDFAVLRLDRPVDDSRRPVPMRLEDTPLTIGEPLTVVGFGSGIPAKIDSGGVVTDPRAGSLDYFQATLDTFGGNSGSGVFNRELELVGILVRGLTDYVRDGDCTRVNVVSEEGFTGGEDITYGTRAREAFCASGAESDLLCPAGASMLCGGCTTDADCQGDLVCAAFASLGGSRICAEPCGRDNPCDAGFTCRAAACEPSSSLACSANSVVRVNQCGRVLDTTDTCTSTEFCRDAACVARPQGDVCASAVPLDLVPGALGDISMDGFGADYAGTCAGNGVDRVYRFSLDTRSQLVTEATGFDTVLYLRGDDCLNVDAEVACNDDSSPPGAYGSRIDVVLDPGDWFLFLDAYNEDTDVAALSWTVTPLCSDDCSEGEALCDGDLPRTCVRDADSGCFYLTDAEPCGSDRVCEAGACVALPVDPDVVDGADAGAAADTSLDATPDTGTTDIDVHADIDALHDVLGQDDAVGSDPDTRPDTDTEEAFIDGTSQDAAESPDTNAGSDTAAAAETSVLPLPDIVVDGSGEGAQPVATENVDSGSPGGCGAVSSPLPVQRSSFFVAMAAIFAARRVRRRG